MEPPPLLAAAPLGSLGSYLRQIVHFHVRSLPSSWTPLPLRAFLGVGEEPFPEAPDFLLSGGVARGSELGLEEGRGPDWRRELEAEELCAGGWLLRGSF